MFPWPEGGGNAARGYGDSSRSSAEGSQNLSCREAAGWVGGCAHERVSRGRRGRRAGKPRRWACRGRTAARRRSLSRRPAWPSSFENLRPRRAGLRGTRGERGARAENGRGSPAFPMGGRTRGRMRAACGLCPACAPQPARRAHANRSAQYRRMRRAARSTRALGTIPCCGGATKERAPAAKPRGRATRCQGSLRFLWPA